SPERATVLRIAREPDPRLRHGGSFLSLVLFLIYLGGMLVVFAYSAALAAEPFPEAWGSRSVLVYVLVYLLGVGLVGSWVIVDGLKEFSVLRGDISGVAVMYSFSLICPYLVVPVPVLVVS
uniref:NADH-ubiquinone oxidoreductase chain 6 n=1 Tax=Sinocyclocheilus rhinocerous TaxID=307959 RepID=A0A673M0K6_9TELE